MFKQDLGQIGSHFSGCYDQHLTEETQGTGERFPLTLRADIAFHGGKGSALRGGCSWHISQEAERRMLLRSSISPFPSVQDPSPWTVAAFVQEPGGGVFTFTLNRKPFSDIPRGLSPTDPRSR